MNEGKIEEAELEKDLALKKSISNEASNKTVKIVMRWRELAS